MNKRKIAILATVGVLTLALTAGAFLAVGVALAQDSGKSGNGAAATFVARVAQILGIEEDKVQTAFTEARRQEEDEMFQARLDRMVADGLLTQEQADERYSWFQARPDSLIRQFGEGKREGKSFRKGRDRDSRGHFRGRDRDGRRGMMGPGKGWRSYGQGPTAPITPAPTPLPGSS